MIPERQDLIDAITRKYLTDPEPERPNGNDHVPELSDYEIITLCRKAKNAAKFAALFDDGDTSGHGGDDSRADMALASMLAFYTDDPAQLDRLITASALGRRKKWRDREDYRRRTVDHAIGHRGERYTHPRNPGPGTQRPEAGEAADEGSANPLLAGRVLLGVGIAGGMEPPDELEPGILLRGKVHSVYAGPGTGKTMFMLWIVAQCLVREQTVVLFDMENGPRIIAERLRSLGASAEQVDRFLCYIPSPNMPLTDATKAAYAELLDQVRPELVVFDSWINFLASAGMDENSSNDVAGWAVTLTHPARDRGIATLLLDHVPHEGGHARGSTRKKDEVDVMWRLHNTQPFDRDSVGEIVLHREKDREAWLPPSVRFSVGGGSAGFVFNRSAGTIEETATGDLTDRQRKALDALRGFGKQGARYGEWRHASGLKGTTFDRAISALTVRGLVRKADGRYFVRPEKQPPPGGSAGEGDGGSTTGSTPNRNDSSGGGESGVFVGDSDNPREPPLNPHHENGGSGDHNPRYPHPPKSGGNGGNPDGGSPEDTIRAVLAAPPPWLSGMLGKWRERPDAMTESVCRAVAAHLFDAGAIDTLDRWREVEPILKGMYGG